MRPFAVTLPALLTTDQLCPTSAQRVRLHLLARIEDDAGHLATFHLVLDGDDERFDVLPRELRGFVASTTTCRRFRESVHL
jgi:hypothetical protein